MFSIYKGFIKDKSLVDDEVKAIKALLMDCTFMFFDNFISQLFEYGSESSLATFRGQFLHLKMFPNSRSSTFKGAIRRTRQDFNEMRMMFISEVLAYLLMR